MPPLPTCPPPKKNYTGQIPVQPTWLPDPILDPNTNDSHYMSYADIKGKETTDKDHPSLKKKPQKEKKQTSGQEVEAMMVTAPVDVECPESNTVGYGYIDIPQSTASLCTVQNARSLIVYRMQKTQSCLL